MSSRPKQPPVHLVEALGELARRGRTGRLLFSRSRGRAGGSMLFQKGGLRRIAPPVGTPGQAGEEMGTAGDRDAIVRLCRAAAADDPCFTEEPLDEAAPAPTVATAADLAIALTATIEDIAWLKNTLIDGPDRWMVPGPGSVAGCGLSHPSLVDSFLVANAGSARPLRQLLGSSPAGQPETLRSLFGLRAIGLIAISDKQETPSGDDSPLSALDDFLSSTDPSATPAPRPHTDVRTAPSPGYSADQTAERERLLREVRRSKQLDHYGVLGVGRKATEEEIRKAYYALARSYHPDKVHKAHLEDIRPELEGMFAAATEAYNTLTDRDLRAEYDRGLIQDLNGPAGADSNERKRSARDLYLRGRKQMEAKNPFEALRLFEAATKEDPSRGEYFHYLGVCQGRNPRWRKKAEANLLKALALNPASIDTHLELARLYKSGGLEHRSRETYEKVLAWDPTNKEALAAVEKAKASAGTGFFHSMFNKD